MSVTGWSEELMKSWQAAQQQYWNNLSGATGFDLAGEKAPEWAAGLDKWWELVNPQVPVQANAVMQRIFDMGKNYAEMAEAMFAADADKYDDNLLESWLSAMEKGFKGWQSQAQDSSGADKFDPGEQWSQDWEKLVGRVGASLFGKPATDSEVSMEAMWRSQFDKFRDLMSNRPEIPPASMRVVSDLGERYQAAMQEYVKAFSGQGLDSVQALRERMADMAKEGATIESLRDLYSLWVDVSEEAFGKFAMSEKYQAIYGEMVNAFVALKGGVDKMADSQLQSMNLLTRNDLEAVLKRQQALERENQALRRELETLSERVSALEMGATASKQSSDDVQTQDELGGESDDLTMIKGLGPKMSEKLIDAGIQTFSHLASLSEEQAKELDKTLKANGRLLRDQWIEQASKFV